MEVKLVNKNGGRLPLAKTYCEEDIVVTIDKSLFDQDYTTEDGLITRTLTYYKNDRIESIGDRVFQNYATEIIVDCPNVTSIGTNCFYGSTGLKQLNLPKLFTVGTNAFYQLTKLKILKLPMVETIATNSCRYSTGIEIAYLPKLKKLDSAVLADCTNLKALIIGSNTTMANTNALIRTAIESGTGYIYVPDADVENVKGSTNFTTYATQIKGWSAIPNDIKEELGL